MKETTFTLSSNMLVKKSWNDISISEYFLLEEIKSDPNISEIEKRNKKLSLLTGIPETEFLRLKNEDIKQFFTDHLGFLNQEIKGDLKEYYFINGKKYKLVKEFDDLTAGQFADNEGYYRDKDLILDKLHLILTVFLLPVRPISAKQALNNRVVSFLSKFIPGRYISHKLRLKYIHGEVENYNDMPVPVKQSIAEEFYNNLSIADTMAISVFFYQVGKAFSMVSALYFDLQTGRELISALKNLESLTPTPEIQSLKEKINLQLDSGGVFQLMK